MYNVSFKIYTKLGAHKRELDIQIFEVFVFNEASNAVILCLVTAPTTQIFLHVMSFKDIQYPKIRTYSRNNLILIGIKFKYTGISYDRHMSLHQLM